MSDGQKAVIPKLPAYRDPEGAMVLVWCEHCRRYHRHRAPVTSAPRIAHCATNGPSPYVRTGYILYDAGTATPQMLRQAGRQELRPEGRQW